MNRRLLRSERRILVDADQILLAAGITGYERAWSFPSSTDLKFGDKPVSN
jgi:hypothetical protein